MTAPPGFAPDLTHHGIATAIASHGEAAPCPDEAALIAQYKAEGKRLSPSRARMLVVKYLAAADRRADANDPALAYVLDYKDDTGEIACGFKRIA